MLLPRSCRPHILNSSLRCGQRIRFVSTLPNNPHIYYFSDPSGHSSNILSFLPTDPPTYGLAIGHTTSIPPTPSTFTSNPMFMRVLQSVIAEHASQDPNVKAQAAAYASQAGSFLGSGGSEFPSNHPARSTEKRARPPGPGFVGTGGAGPTVSQGGMGGAGRGGFVHVSDLRHPPDFGRIADPEDIFGTLEVDGAGQFVSGGGNYQESGTYRIVSSDGILGLSSFLREKLVEKLKELEALEKK